MSSVVLLDNAFSIRLFVDQCEDAKKKQISR